MLNQPRGFNLLEVILSLLLLSLASLSLSRLYLLSHQLQQLTMQQFTHQLQQSNQMEQSCHSVTQLDGE